MREGGLSRGSVITAERDPKTRQHSADPAEGHMTDGPQGVGPLVGSAPSGQARLVERLEAAGAGADHIREEA